MAITDAQQAKQIMMKKGGPVIQAGVKNYKPSKMVTVPKVAKSSPTHPTAKLAYITDAEKKLLIKKNLHGSLKGKPNRGPGGIPSLQGDFGPGGKGDTYGGAEGPDVSGKRDTGTGDYRDSTRPADVAARREYERNRAAREKAERERKEKERVQKEIDKYNKAQAKKVNRMRRNKTLQDMLEDEELEKQNQTLGFGDRLDKGLNKIGLGKKGFIERTKASNLKDLGMLDKKFGTIGGVPVGFTTGILEAFNVPKETAMFDIDSIREIGSVLGKQKTGMTKSQSKTLGDLRQDIQVEDKYNRGTLTNQEFQDYMNRNKLPERDDRGPEPILPIVPPIVQPAKDDKEEEEDPFQLALAFRADGGRVPYENGGITTLEEAKRMAPPGESLAYINNDEAALLKLLGGAGEDINGTGIKSYFIKKIYKKGKKAVKKVFKSPIGKAAILGAMTFGIPGTGFSGIGGGLGGFAKKFGFDAIKKKIAGASFNQLAGLSVGGGLLAGALAGKGYEDEDGDGFDDKTGFSPEEYRQKGARGDVPIAFRSEGGMSDVENDPQYKGWKRIFEVNPDAAEMHPKHREFVKYYRSTERETKEEGGMMDLKGMEMDFRDDGGFVPIGKKERADDVPARLSKNEFVMTADAVRGAGDGNIDKGAEKMYNLMSKLEAENDQSQGLDGARKMFKTAQRLEEVL